MPDLFWGIAYESYDTLQRCSAKMQKDVENNAFQEKHLHIRWIVHIYVSGSNGWSNFALFGMRVPTDLFHVFSPPAR